MVAGNTAQVPKEIVEALEALERLVVRYGTLPRDRAEAAAAYLTKDFEGVTLELDKKPEDLAPAPEVARAPRPMRPMRTGGPRRRDAPAEGAPAAPPAEPPAQDTPPSDPA